MRLAQSKNAFHRMGRSLQDHFEIKSTNRSTLPEALLAKTGITSWLPASLAVGGGFYLIFLIVGLFDGTLSWLSEGGYWRWRTSLMYPTLIIYLLLVQPPLGRLLTRAIDAFTPLLPTIDRSEQLIATAYSLNRRREWLAISLGIVCGWLVDPPWAKLSFALELYTLLGGGLVFGLTGWHIYSGLVRTRILAALHGQVQDLNIFRQQAPVAPIFRWSIGTASVLIGGIIISLLFIPPSDLQNRTTLILYGILITAAVLIIAFSKVPHSLMARISIFRAITLFLTVAVIGTFGYNYFEGWKPIDAFYATIITMTTIGYGDLSPVTDAGRLFTIVLSLFAIGIGGYAISSFAAFVVEGNFNQFLQGKRVYKQIDKLNHHVILCGAGRVGKQIAIEFHKTRIPFVIIEQSKEVLEALLREIEFPYIQGDATQDSTLELAGIERARGLITTLSDDKANAFVVLSSRELAKKQDNANVRVISRVNEEKHRTKLEKAGASATISPHAIGGQRMARVMLHPDVVTFLEEIMAAEKQTGQVLRMEEVHVDKINNPVLAELLDKDRLTVKDIGQQTGLMVIVIKHPEADEDNLYLYTPTGETRLRRGDVLIVIGTPDERAALRDEDPPGFIDIWRTKTIEILTTWIDKIALGS